MSKFNSVAVREQSDIILKAIEIATSELCDTLREHLGTKYPSNVAFQAVNLSILEDLQAVLNARKLVEVWAANLDLAVS